MKAVYALMCCAKTADCILSSVPKEVLRMICEWLMTTKQEKCWERSTKEKGLFYGLRGISREEGEKMAEELRMEAYLECAATDVDSVHRVFIHILKHFEHKAVEKKGNACIMF